MEQLEPDESAPRHEWHGAANTNSSIRLLVGAERVTFTFVGVLFFLAAFAVAIRSIPALWIVATGPHATIIEEGSEFLNLMLLVLMLVELA